MSKLQAVPVTLREANDFVENFHRHNKRTVGGKWGIGVSDGTELWGVAIVGRAIARMLDVQYTAEVLRTCVKLSAPKGCNSFLYAHCWQAWRAMGGLRLVTYTLTTESGASLRGAGWKVIAECKPGGWDRESRARDWQPIYGQAKLRWEVSELTP